MEEAYSDLYQQFLRLQSLCLRQAALLHQLSTALQKQQGATVVNGELSDMMSIPVQCTQAHNPAAHNPAAHNPAAHNPAAHNPAAHNPAAHSPAAHNPAAHSGINGLSANAGTFSDLLAGDMSKLHVDVLRQSKEGGVLEQKVSSLSSLDSSRWRGASASHVSKNPGHAEHHSGDRKMVKVTMPLMDAPNLVCNMDQSDDGLLMSDVALLSHVCEFCQAVFPGDSTTRGEFLRHLCTHVT